MTVKQELKNDSMPEPETPEVYAERWNDYLRKEIRKIEDIGRTDKKVDVNRAVRGIIIREISGDAGNSLLGAILIANNRSSTFEHQQLIRSGFECTWLACKRAVLEFGERLPPLTLMFLKDVFEKYERPMIDVISGEEKNSETIVNLGIEVVEILKNKLPKAPGFRESDIDYATSVLHPKLL